MNIEENYFFIKIIVTVLLQLCSKFIYIQLSSQTIFCPRQTFDQSFNILLDKMIFQWFYQEKPRHWLYKAIKN